MTDKVLLLDLVQERIRVSINRLDVREIKMIKKNQDEGKAGSIGPEQLAPASIKRQH